MSHDSYVKLQGVIYIYMVSIYIRIYTCIYLNYERANHGPPLLPLDGKPLQLLPLHPGAPRRNTATGQKLMRGSPLAPSWPHSSNFSGKFMWRNMIQIPPGLVECLSHFGILQEDLDSRGCGKVLVNQMQRELILLPYAPITWWETRWPRSLRASQSEKDGKRRSDDLCHFVQTSWETIETYRDHHFLSSWQVPHSLRPWKHFATFQVRLTISSWNSSPSWPGILLNCSRRYFGN